MFEISRPCTLVKYSFNWGPKIGTKVKSGWWEMTKCSPSQLDLWWGMGEICLDTLTILSLKLKKGRQMWEIWPMLSPILCHIYKLIGYEQAQCRRNEIKQSMLLSFWCPLKMVSLLPILPPKKLLSSLLASNYPLPTCCDSVRECHGGLWLAWADVCDWCHSVTV